jgi:uncharacterized protein (DUF342 family)
MSTRTNVTRHGYCEVKLNHDKTQAFVMLYPPTGNGEDVLVPEVVQRLRNMGVQHGFREREVLEGIRQAREAELPVQVVGAEGVVPKDGQDGRVRYLIPEEVITTPLPKHSAFPHLPNWFALNAARRVVADQPLASIMPAQAGTHGKTLTLPVQTIPCKSGKPIYLRAGENVRVSDDGIHLFAMCEGYAAVHGDQVTLYAVREVRESVCEGEFSFPRGVAFFQDVENAHVTARDLIGVQGTALNCTFRAHGNVLIGSAKMSRIVASGDVYVVSNVRDCEIVSGGKIVFAEGATLVGGTTQAKESLEAYDVGSEEFVETYLEIGSTRFSEIARGELEEEIGTALQNRTRIQQALRPFLSKGDVSSFSPETQALIQKLQGQLRFLEVQIKEAQTAQRDLAGSGREFIYGEASVRGCLYPGVWVKSGKARMQIEQMERAVHIITTNRGARLEREPLEKAA